MKRRIGSSLLAAGLLVAFAAFAQKELPHGVVAGTVFRDPGFALRGATVVMIAVPDPGSPVKPWKEKMISNDRGEFAFRVPPTEMHYKVSVTAKGFQGQEKTVEIRGEERAEATFMLQEASK